MIKQAWQAVVDSGVPEEIQGEAFKAAVPDIRGTALVAPLPNVKGGGDAKRKKKSAAVRPSGKSSQNSSPSKSVLNDVGDADEFFARIAHETDVVEQDLRDLFHVESGALELKLASKDLGDNNKAKTVTVACLLYTSPSPRDRTRSRMPSSA